MDGYWTCLSSTRAEIAGLTAVTIVAKLLLDFFSSPAKVSIICNNQGAITKCSKPGMANLRYHRRPNTDLLITQPQAVAAIPISYKWVKGHLDKEAWNCVSDLEKQNLSHKEIFNVCCNNLVECKWHVGSSSSFNPKVSPEERWVIFTVHPQLHKLIGDLSTEISKALAYNKTFMYITEKHNLC